MSFFIFYFLLFQTRTCYFHFLKALRKHLGDCHILPLLATNTQFASFVHLIYSLPYVPTANVIGVYEDVILKSLARIKKSTHPDIVANIGNITKWVDYLERTWIGREEKERSKASGKGEEKERSKASGKGEEKERSKASGKGEEKERSKASGKGEEKERSKTSGKREEKDRSTPVEEEKVTRTAGLYPLYKWNQYEAAVEMWPRTNNSSEGNCGFCITVW
jgi:hypothetical protein